LEKLDIVVGSRYTVGGDAGGLSSRNREAISKLGGKVARLILHADLTDPMSGFFVMSRAAFDETVHDLSQQGFKILLDIFASSPRPLRFAEVPCRFHSRQHGESKLDTKVAWEFGMLIADKLVGRFIPGRFVVFALIGGTGLIVHLVALALAGSVGFNFTFSQSFAVVVAMTWNFIFNNVITYRDQKLRGIEFFRGLMTFYAIGAFGAFANVGVAELIHLRGWTWWLAGLSGALVGVAWNFTMSSFFTWRRNTVQ
jgi:dolichol-phosphate mannosyltransferase